MGLSHRLKHIFLKGKINHNFVSQQKQEVKHPFLLTVSLTQLLIFSPIGQCKIYQNNSSNSGLLHLCLSGMWDMLQLCSHPQKEQSVSHSRVLLTGILLTQFSTIQLQNNFKSDRFPNFQSLQALSVIRPESSYRIHARQNNKLVTSTRSRSPLL